MPDYWTNAFRSQLDLQLVQGVNSALTFFYQHIVGSHAFSLPRGLRFRHSGYQKIWRSIRWRWGAATLSGDGPPWRGSGFRQRRGFRGSDGKP